MTTPAERTVRLSGAALVAALVVLLAFAVFVVFLLTEVGATEPRWTRLAWVFASVEAIAFGAAGALFGSSVQRERAEKAETAAARNATDAANGRALASTLQAEDPGGGAQPEGPLESLGPGQARDAASAVARRHAELARRLFPS